MKILDYYNRPKNIGIKKYRIKWDEKSPSKFQFQVKQFFKQFWSQDVVFEEFIIPASKLRIDLFNLTKGIVVEINGSQHYNYNRFHYKNRAQFLQSINRDLNKEEWIKNNKFKFIEIMPEDLKLLSRKYILEKFLIDII